MKTLSTIAVLATLALAGCAAAPSLPQGLVAGKFVQMNCEGGAFFSARFTEDAKSVRVRSQHGSAELDFKGEGVYEGEGYQLATSGDNAVSLMHNGKPFGKKCKAA